MAEPLVWRVASPVPAHALEEALRAHPDRLPHGRFAERELSWLQFNERVLELAEDPLVPLLERSFFLSVFASNLDEFFMVRVAGLKRRLETKIGISNPAGISGRRRLEEILARSRSLMERHAAAFAEQVRPALAREGIVIVSWESLAEAEQEKLGKFFKKHIFPVLTPLAVDPAHPFPYISGLCLNIAVTLRERGHGRELFARVKVPELLPRFIAVDEEGKAYRPSDAPTVAEGEIRFIPLEDLISAHLSQLFPGMDVIEHSTFRLTRNEDMEVDEDVAGDLLHAIEKELKKRRFGPAVRLEVEETMPKRTVKMLMKELDIRSEDVMRLPGPLDLTGLGVFHDLDLPALKYEPYLPTTPPALAGGEDIFAAIRREDILVHHPYDSFSTSVQAFLEQAAQDPHVLAIKQTLYRTSSDSPIVHSLIRAANAGKQVLAVVEIKARFDEEANIEWATKLEQAGVHVVYGVVGLKTHCKLCMVVREEAGSLRRYCHVGTGNYHPKTARGYEDFGVLTANREVGEDLTKLFNRISGYAPRASFHRLLVAPSQLRTGILKEINRQRERALAHEEAWIKIKVNSIVDEDVIDALYRASQAGVKIEVLVRGICALRPGIAGLSENIHVRSILGRYLEHSRIYAFAGSDTYIGSADLMHRNLDRRIEALISLGDSALAHKVQATFDLAMSDDIHCWELTPDGWEAHAGRDYHDLLMQAHRS